MSLLGLLKKSKKGNYKSNTDGEDTPPSKEKTGVKAPMDDAVAGEEYSKVGRKEGNGPDSDTEIEDDMDEDGMGQGHDAAAHAAFDSFADHAGIPAERRRKAQAALKMYVSACHRGSKSEE